MYSKKLRFPLGRERFNSEKSFNASGFVLKIKNNKMDGNRFAVIISSRAVKKSARRHFWKRVIADALARMPNVKKDFLVIVSKNVEDFSPRLIREEISKIATKLKAKS